MSKSFIWVLALIMGTVISCSTETNRPKFVPIQTQTNIQTSQIQPAQSTAATPVIARVNGEAILLADLQLHMKQSEASLIRYNSEGQIQTGQQILNQLIDQKIIEQEARLRGIEINEATLSQEISALKQGYSAQEFEAWLQLNHYTPTQFEQAFRMELLAARFFADIGRQMPTFAEQIHARQIVVSDYNLAQSVFEQLQAGESFSELAQIYSEDEASRMYGGDLGWFPKNINKLPPQVETAAFNLSNGQSSNIIQAGQLYYLIKVELKEQNRALTPQHRQALQQYMFKSWLAQQRTTARIERYTQ